MDAPSSLWIVLDPKAGPEFAAAWREGAHEHIKDCLDGGTNEAARWVVREYVPIAEVERLRADVASLTAQLQSGESFHAVAVRQRDAAWKEIEALRADAERWEHARSIACFTEDRDMGPGGWWTVAVHVKRRPAANTIDAAVDAARAAQGGET